MDKALRNFIIVGIVSFSLVIIFYFAYLPFKEKYNLNKCLEISENIYNKKFQEITDHIKDLESQKEFAQKEANEKFNEFQKEKLEPKKEDFIINSEQSNKSNKTILDDARIRAGLSWEYLNSHSRWISEKNEIFKDVDRIKNLINLIDSDYKKIEKEKEGGIDACYKKYK